MPPIEFLISISPLLIVVVTAIYYHIRLSSRLDRLEVEFKGLSERLERLEQALSQDLRDLTQKLDRFIYNLASNKKSDD